MIYMTEGTEMENQDNTKPKEQKQENEKLLRLMTGYGQHASPFSLYTTSIPNVLIQMKKDNKSARKKNKIEEYMTAKLEKEIGEDEFFEKTVEIRKYINDINRYVNIYLSIGRLQRGVHRQ